MEREFCIKETAQELWPVCTDLCRRSDDMLQPGCHQTPPTRTPTPEGDAVPSRGIFAALQMRNV